MMLPLRGGSGPTKRGTRLCVRDGLSRFHYLYVCTFCIFALSGTGLSALATVWQVRV